VSKIMISKIKLKSKKEKQWPCVHCPVCGKFGSLCQDGFPLLTDWWFYCARCSYSEQVAPITELTPHIGPIDVNDQAVFENLNALSVKSALRV